MSKQPPITTISSGFFATSKFNENFTNIRDQFDNTLSLDGSTPNAMGADLDMNSNDILNANQIDTTSLYVSGNLLTTTTAALAPDANAVNYNQGGTGAVDRTVESRLQDFISVKDFGAVGDGVTDDTAAIQAACDYLSSTDLSLYSEFLQPNYETKFTVGATGNFANINQALKALSAFDKKHKALGVSLIPNKVTLELQSGFVMAEQVFVYEKDLSFVEISSVDPVVTITRSAITQVPSVSNWVTGYTPVFTAMRGAKLPTINCLFNMDTTGTTTGNRVGIFLHENASAVVTRTNGITNCDGRGVEVSGSTFYGRETNFSGSLDAAYRISNGSTANIRQSNGSGSVRGLYATAAMVTAIDCDFSDCSEYAIYATGASVVHAADTAAGTADLSGAGIHGVLAEDSSIVNVAGADISGSTANGIDARSGAIVNAVGANLSGAGSKDISIATGAYVNMGTVGSELTISGGVISVSSKYHKVDTEADAATDDLDTINGGYTGQVLTLQAISNVRDIVVKHGTGNLYLAGLADFTMDSSKDSITLVYNGSDWNEISRSNNG